MGELGPTNTCVQSMYFENPREKKRRVEVNSTRNTREREHESNWQHHGNMHRLKTWKTKLPSLSQQPQTG